MVKKYIPEGLDGIEKFQYEPVKRESSTRFLGFSMCVEDSGKTGKKQRIFDITKYRRRHIALRVGSSESGDFQVFYDGSHMSGFAQRDSAQLLEGVADDNSVETAIFAALKRVHLIDDITKCHYQRCGRTDAGVSAFNQVISLYLRSNLRSGVEFVDEFDPTISYHAPENAVSSAAEFDYPSVPSVSSCSLGPEQGASAQHPSHWLVSCGPHLQCSLLLLWSLFVITLRIRSCVSLLLSATTVRHRVDAPGGQAAGRRARLPQLLPHRCCQRLRLHANHFPRRRDRHREGVLVPLSLSPRDVPEHDVLAVEIVGRAFLWHQVSV